MYFSRFLASCFFFLLSINLLAAPQPYPNVQWASHVIGFSSEYQEGASIEQYSSAQALGKPNKLPAVGNSACAWSPEKENGRHDEWLHVGFSYPMPIRQVVIAESFNAGAVSHVYAYDREEREYLLYKELDNRPVPSGGRMLNVVLKEVTPYEVKSIKIVLTTLDVPGWNHIDAVGISPSAKPIKAKINLGNDKRPVVVEKLPGILNTRYDEILPVISPDGKTLYFDRKNHPQNLPSIEPDEANDDIWVSHFTEEGWGKPRRLPYPLNNSGHNYVCSVTPDGNTLLLGNIYLASGEVMGGVSMSHKLPDGRWSFPKALEIDGYYNKNAYSEYFLGPNRKVLLLAIERDDSQGSRDLYVSFLKANGRWSEPRNLGKRLNTAGTELTPFLASDGKTLYFASNGHSGYGSCDMFMTRRLDESWTSWTEPVNLGPTLNSPDWDASYTIDAAGEYAYFVSYKNSNRGSADIFRARLPQDVRPEPVVLLHGTVYNAKTNEPIAADIRYEHLENGEEVGLATANPENGAYKIVLPIAEQYGFRAGAKGFFSVHENIDLENVKEYREIQKDLYLMPIEVGQKIPLNNVFFEQSRAELLPSSFPELDRLARQMLANAELEIELIGHTDIEGSPTQNLKLSAMRVMAIKQYLIRKGVTPQRIQTKAMGGREPLTRKRDPDSKQRNRRVEFRISK